jgi:protein-L-isoaspartate(D-aspartate) O-methyltransferase
VTTIDIDPVVVANTRRALDLAGYPQVEALCADGEYGHPGGGLFDAIIVSVETADIPPAWIAQLTPGGRLVVPLRMRGHTRCLTLTSDGDHLIAGDNPLQCGFVSMQGHGAIAVRRVPLHGDAIVLVLDDPSTQADAVALRAALERTRVEQWSPVTIDKARSAPLERLHLWLASQPGPYGILKVDREKAAGLVDPQDRFFDPVLLDQEGTSLAYLAMRDLDSASWELGAHAFGPNAAALTAALLELIGVWDRHLRDGPGPRITIHPAGTAISAASGLQLQIPRRHTQTVIIWPPTA